MRGVTMACEAGVQAHLLGFPNEPECGGMLTGCEGPWATKDPASTAPDLMQTCGPPGASDQGCVGILGQSDAMRVTQIFDNYPVPGGMCTRPYSAKTPYAIKFGNFGPWLECEFMGTILGFMLSPARGMFRSQADLACESAWLREQLGTYLRRGKRPKLRPTDRALWVVLRRVWPRWRNSLAIVKPRTVIGWHRQGFRLFWRWKSRVKRVGRPPIPRAHIDLIRRMSRENPSWGEDRIAQELRLKLGIEHSTSTVRKYMVRRPSPDGGQSWRRFVTNHSREVFACDFLVQYTGRFEVVSVFVVMEVGSRRIALVNATRAPTLDWVKGQLRELASYGGGPSVLVHDNDGIVGQFGARSAERSYRCHLDLWLRVTLGIRGVPTPYRAPNANAYVERFNRALREEALDHFIFLNEGHVRRVCREYVEFYNRARPSQAIGRIPDPHPEIEVPRRETSSRVVGLPVLGGLQHEYRAAA